VLSLTLRGLFPEPDYPTEESNQQVQSPTDVGGESLHAAAEKQFEGSHASSALAGHLRSIKEPTTGFAPALHFSQRIHGRLQLIFSEIPWLATMI